MVVKRFINSGEAWYGPTAVKPLWGNRVKAELNIGLDASDGGTYGEWRVTWDELAPGRTSANLHAFSDGWKALKDSKFLQVMIEAGDNCTVEEFTEVLLKHGWKDMTPGRGRVR